MTQVLNLTGLGMASQLARNSVGVTSISQTATGSSSQTNSFAITNDITSFSTAASNSGARLPAGSPGDNFIISNGDVNTMLIYPPVGGKLNYGTLNASVNLTTLKSAECVCLDGLNYIVMVGA